MQMHRAAGALGDCQLEFNMCPYRKDFVLKDVRYVIPERLLRSFVLEVSGNVAP